MSPDQRLYIIVWGRRKWRSGNLLLTDNEMLTSGILPAEAAVCFKLAQSVIEMMLLRGRVAVSRGFYLKNPRL